MADKFQNKYRIKSHRKPSWDYNANGLYFITIVTQNRECILGKIVNNETQLSHFGEIVKIEWLKSFEIRNELFLDEYIIMPNHLHAIVIIDNVDSPVDSPVDSHGRAYLQSPTDNYSNLGIAYRLPKSISSFIAGFKSAVNSKIDDYIDKHHLDIPKYNRNNHFFQPNYHDRIIRNDAEYRRIKNYIINNPINWSGDKFNKTRKE